MQSVERCVFGCDYGVTSWADRDEADELVTLLGLAPGMRLLNVGAGSGWPGLYLAQTPDKRLRYRACRRSFIGSADRCGKGRQG